MADFWQKKGWARRALWEEEDQVRRWRLTTGSGTAGSREPHSPGRGCGGGRALLMPPLLAPGRIIYFSNWGGRSRECPASASSAGSSEERGAAPGGSGSRALGPKGRQRDAGCVTQVAAGRGEAAAQRYGAPGTGAGPGSGWRAVAEGPWRVPASPPHPVTPCSASTLSACVPLGSGSLSLNLCVWLLSLPWPFPHVSISLSV